MNKTFYRVNWDYGIAKMRQFVEPKYRIQQQKMFSKVGGAVISEAESLGIPDTRVASPYHLQKKRKLGRMSRMCSELH